MFVELLDGIANSNIIPQEQPSDPALSLRCFPRLPQDGEINWQQSAQDLAKLVRASAEPFAGAYSFLNGEKVTIWRVHPEPIDYPYLGVPGQVIEIRYETKEVAVLTSDGMLILEEIETLKKGRRRSSDIIKSCRVRLGMNVSDEISQLKQRITELEQLIKKITKLI
ncbi:hypothetical protein [Cuspidothrix issatschenkoi]|uniref:Methionyl-tRNA formyltransferase n=1 Tax=Cuspidothrix issatschenkoi CHARLIE-1 TaxID=2052836 RepID=A0A2S6CTH3_9CYAN|nr:hypothetical protein [Cuspidothrix issatschenkoi]PPJ63036.1 hypothetical protein CUN59_12460 [Cuspidothrix issatschenkoi CHARLIE-1]